MSALPHRRPDGRALKRRADYFFRSRLRARGEVAEFAAKLGKLGPTVAIGGLLRDLCLAGNRDFRSDVDFVVDPVSIRDFDYWVHGLGGKANRFGGHSFQLSRWKVEVWPLQKTWAAVEGHAEVKKLNDLLGVTFFDWDAILYSVSDQRLIPSGAYFERLCDRIIDINLEPNPNPLGNAVRALRYAYRFDARIGQKLAEHLRRQLRDHGWRTLVTYEQAAFPNRILPALNGDLVVQHLRDHDRRCSGPVSLPITPRQHEFTFTPP